MHQHKLLFSILVLSAVIAITHVAAIEFSIYWTLVWFDLVVHFLGGILIGLIGIWLLRFWHVRLSPRQVFVGVLGTVLVVGGLWEVFEWLAGNLMHAKNPVLDTTLDLLMDVLGGAAAYVLAGDLLVREKSTDI